jgi:phosphatidylinositol mannoside-binding LppM-like protein
MRSKFVPAFLSLLLAVLYLSACRVVVETRIDQNGSGELRNSVVFSAEEKANFEASPENAGRSICDNLKQGAQVDTEFLEEIRDGETFCTTKRLFAGLSELQGYYQRLGNVRVNELKKGLSNFVFDIQVDLQPRDGNEVAPSEWRLTLPGEIGTNNAESIDGQTLIWNVDPGEVAILHAESSVPINAWIWVGAGLAAALGIVSIYLVRRSR